MPKQKSKRKSEQKLNVETIIRVGDKDYNVTNMKPGDFPDEVKAALVPAQKLYAKLLVDRNWKNFYDNLPSDLKDAYDAAPQDERKKIFGIWAEHFSREVSKQ